MSSDHSIVLGGKVLQLRKNPSMVRVLRPGRATLRHVRESDSVRGIHYDGGDVWRLRVWDTFRTDRLISELRESSIVHHVYEIADSDMPAQFIPNDRIYLRLSARSRFADMAAVAERFRLKPIRKCREGIVLFGVTVETGSNPIKLCESLLSSSDFDIVEPDHFVNVRRNAPDWYAHQWHLHAVQSTSAIRPDAHISVEKAWEFTRGSPNVVVAIVDDGFDLTNPDLQGNIVNACDFTSSEPAVPSDFSMEIVPRDSDPSADATAGDYHGTPCAGLAIARGVRSISGVAPACSWMPVRVAFGLVAHDDTLRMFEYISRRADVASCSWGVTPTSFHLPTEAQRATFTYLHSKGGRKGNGLITCFAAGNENLPTSIDAADNVNGFEYFEPSGEKLGTFFRNKELHSSWCELPDVICVGAVSPENRKSLYSNWGRDVHVVAPSDSYDVGASRPLRGGGPRLVTTDNENFGRGLREAGIADTDLGFVTDSMGGTSGATAQVAGVCALIAAANPSLSAAQIRDLIAETATRSILEPTLPQPPFNNAAVNGAFNLEGGRRSAWFGYGRVDAGEAVKLALN